MTKKKLILSSILLVCILAFNITTSFGLFETNAKASSSMAIGKWSITLNDEDIALSQNITFDDFAFTGSQHVEEGYFAPGTTGTFDIEIDMSGCDTSVEYDLVFDTSQFDTHPNISLVIEDVDTNQTITNGEVQGIVYINDTNKVKRFSIELVWNDVQDYNENDVELIGKTLNLAVTSNFKQYTGE